MNKKLLIISQNLLKYQIGLMEENATVNDIVLRVNLAWHKDLRSAAELITDYMEYSIFLDVPIGRKKPPNYKHELEDVAVLALSFPNVEYVAISNIENANQINYYQSEIPGVKIVPKIETYIGVKNARDIIEALNYEEKVIMLDHQDLYSDLVVMGREKEYLELVASLEIMCKRLGGCLLRTVGVVFAEWVE